MKIEIEIRDDISPNIALDCVGNVISKGRISKGANNKMYYCWCSTFSIFNIDDIDYKVAVWVRNNRKNDCFIVSKNK